MSAQIRITVSREIDVLLSKLSKRLGKKKSMLARELMEQKMYDLNLIQKQFMDLYGEDEKK
jgi:predicted DNA-binding protein